ncbi:MAG: peptidoglycan editing factor PgeF [Alphaproteobacteria bacterium]|nr:peptidoglycan editing factor PgeF [Alphaproteobacteria bacterium]
MTLIKQQKNGLIYHHNPHWNIPHGFFTRKISDNASDNDENIYKGLNCGIGSNDAPDRVQANLNHVCQTLLGNDANKSALALLHQYHSARLIAVPFAAHAIRAKNGRVKGDAMISMAGSDCKNLMGIMTADCVPVLFYDKQTGITAAAHAGWKGALAGVLESTITAMRAMYGMRYRDNAQNIEALIGPAIAQKSYQVGAEFYDNFIERDSNYQQFFIPDSDISDNGEKQTKYLFDLKNFVKHLLTQAGVHTITVSPDDTVAQEDDYFSYRRSCLRGEADYGRNISVIGFQLLS